jgi:hypothetical protein
VRNELTFCICKLWAARQRADDCLAPEKQACGRGSTACLETYVVCVSLRFMFAALQPWHLGDRFNDGLSPSVAARYTA